MRVLIERTGGVVTSVVVVGEAGVPVQPEDRFLRHVLDAGGSPNTAAAYGYDLRYLLEFLGEWGLGWREFRPAIALELLGWLRRRPSGRSAQRLGLSVAVAEGRLLAPATVARVLAAVSSFYEWAIVAEAFEGENPMQRRGDVALSMVPEGISRSPAAPAVSSRSAGWCVCVFPSGCLVRCSTRR